MALRQLAFHGVVMHHDNARGAGSRVLEFRARALDLRTRQVPDDRDVAEVPGERLASDALRRVQSDERRARVTVFSSRIVASSAPRIRCARSLSPMWSSNMHAARITAPGLATPFPAISGAVPCTASKIAPFTPMLAPGARPSPPTNPEIWS